MEMIAVWLKVDPEQIVGSLEEAVAKLNHANGELILDCSSVRQVGAAAIRALTNLATAAEEKGIKIILRGVNVDVYKVLKLDKLTQRFSFLN